MNPITPDQYQTMLNNYASIVERTNQQLSLWTNPYGLMVGALAVLFTALTIVAVVIIYRESREYKEKLQVNIDQYKKHLDEFLTSQKAIIEERNKQATEAEEKIDKLLDEYKEKLEASSKSQKVEIEKAIQKLEEEKISIGGRIGPLTVSPNPSLNPLSSIFGSSAVNDFHKCTKCGFGFFVEAPHPGSIYLSSLSSRTVTCPKCGNTDSY